MTDASNGTWDLARIDELLAGRALGDLSPAETLELGDILSKQPLYDTDEFDRVAAALASSPADTDVLPEQLKSTILADAPAHLSQQPSARKPSSQERANIRLREALAWLVATVCVVALGIQFLGQQDAGPEKSPTLAEQRRELMESGTESLVIEWSQGPTPFASDVGGDVVWNQSTQTGFLRFTDMPINDPSIEQYQLWIIDPDRDEQPIDGGVFDITRTGEVIVPIDAKLAVISPRAFAITIEQPGGVVVSSQERLPLLAQVSL